MRRFYKKQDHLIDSLQKFYEQTSLDSKKEDYKLKKQKRHTEWLIRATLICNIVCQFIQVERKILLQISFLLFSVITRF